LKTATHAYFNVSENGYSEYYPFIGSLPPSCYKENTS